MDHLRDLYAGDIASASVAHAEAHEHADQVTADCCASRDADPDGGPYSAGWYYGDVDAARAAHSQHCACAS